ncbi:MAG: hypothetical protein M5U26_08670 [Planctomycetota bacterium]|nr:hypothetical protein [Planctomycetota bacterium]
MPLPLPVLLILATLALAGSAWLLSFRCRIDLAQFLAGFLAYGLLLGAVHLLAVEPQLRGGPPDAMRSVEQLYLAFLLVLGLGLFLGANNARRAERQGAATRWIVFFAGLLAPLTTVPGVMAAWVLLSGGLLRPVSGGATQGLLTVALLVPAVTTVFAQIYLHENTPEPEA